VCDVIDASPAMSAAADTRQIRALGYLCVPSHVEKGCVSAWGRQMSAFAIGEGLTITRWFVDDRRSAGARFAEMTAALQGGEADRVVVPEPGHLARSQDGTGWLVHHVLGSYLGVRVHAMHGVDVREVPW
jgi:hypothetical protein